MTFKNKFVKLIQETDKEIKYTFSGFINDNFLHSIFAFFPNKIIIFSKLGKSVRLLK